VAERARTGHATTLGGASGAVAGLVAITPAAGYVDSLPAMLLGAVAGVAAFGAVRLKFRLGYDDTLDVVGVHYVGGFVGMLLLGIFASHAVNPAVHHQGLAYSGSLWLLGRQALAVVVSTTFAFTATYVVARLVNAVVPLRCTPEEEYDGLDQSQHAESAYDFGLARTTAGRIGT
ncbi:MAG TPA: ammonia channel protein, partial [Mycobacteriales bacterium]|nr:ammonia channel protein [Mycobacteriales bacterium]